MRQRFKNDLFAKHMREKRVIDTKNDISISLRSASKQNGIKFMTLSRIENGNKPDLETFATACKWMGKPMNIYFKSKTN